MRELEPCPACGSGDVGGASGIVHCYVCKAEVRAATTPEAVERWNIRAIFLRHGFIIPADGEALYAAARELLATDRARRDNPDDVERPTSSREARAPLTFFRYLARKYNQATPSVCTAAEAKAFGFKYPLTQDWLSIHGHKHMTIDRAQRILTSLENRDERRKDNKPEINARAAMILRDFLEQAGA